MASVDLDQVTPTIEPLVMNTERGRTWTALFNAEVEDMHDNDSAATPAIIPSSESVPAPPVATGSTAVEEEQMEVVEEKKEASTPVSAQPPRQQSRLEKLRQDVVRQKESGQVKPLEPVIDVVMGSQSWHNEVPRVRILEIVSFLI